ncbi:MAG: HupE/UreJ family protein [Opitutaceae bacterium]
MRTLRAVLTALILPLVLRAHDPGISTAQGEWSGGALVLTTGFAPVDIQTLLPGSFPRHDVWGQAEFEAARPLLLALAPGLWELVVSGAKVPVREVSVELLPGDNVSFRHVLPVPGSPGDLTLRAARVPDLPEGHRQFVIISDQAGSTVAKKLVSRRDFTLAVASTAPSAVTASTGGAVPLSAQSEPGDLPSAFEFLKLGVEHIWTGYDHLLFLFALLVVCTSFRSTVAIITCFTLAHSLTLALATLDVVHVPSRWVEPLIAASIVFVGVENLIRRGAEPPGRWALTFVFGLVHGFGFAGILRDLGLGSAKGGILMPLFSFNLGVELGQIAIAAIVLPLVWRLRKKEAFVARGVPALSAVVTLMGLYWLLARTVL